MHGTENYFYRTTITKLFLCRIIYSTEEIPRSPSPFVDLLALKHSNAIILCHVGKVIPISLTIENDKDNLHPALYIGIIVSYHKIPIKDIQRPAVHACMHGLYTYYVEYKKYIY